MIVKYSDVQYDCWPAISLAMGGSQPVFWGSEKSYKGLQTRSTESAWLPLPNYQYVEIKS